ncbi:MAG: type II toxin-antitoxin system Phd/YefM family antitoxin [Limisphaerales bacterium]
MAKNRWQLQEAKNHLSQVVENALANQPQVITRHGKEAVVVVSFRDWSRHAPRRKKLVDVLRGCPFPDLEIPRDRDVPRELPRGVNQGRPWGGSSHHDYGIQ